jgi:hypothetical protein
MWRREFVLTTMRRNTASAVRLWQKQPDWRNIAAAAGAATFLTKT